MWAQLCLLKIHMVEPLHPETQNMTVFGEGVFKDVEKPEFMLPVTTRTNKTRVFHPHAACRPYAAPGGYE